jgi:glutaredoxin
MHKKTIGIILAATILFIVGIIFWGTKQANNSSFSTTSATSGGNSQADIVLYYGAECPHCLNVEKFITDNKIDEKISFAKKEVWHNTTNNTDMENKAKECALDTSKIGVPFLYARGKCFVGEIEVENFFKKEAGL